MLYLSDSPILIQIGFQYAEQQVGHDQRDYDVEHLGRHESPERAAVFLSNRTYYKDERAQWIKDRDVLIEIMKKELIRETVE